MASIFLIGCFCQIHGEDPEEASIDLPGAYYFTPPSGWRLAEQSQLPEGVKVMVVGKGGHVFAPSINLTIEPFKGSLKQYLKIVKSINDSKGASWQNLGTIRTQAGTASLSQVDTKTKWGETRMMHVIFLKDKKVYILTAAALREEFPQFYQEFFQSLRSFHMNKNVYEMISNPKKRTELEKKIALLKNDWLIFCRQEKGNALSEKELFLSEHYQEKYWKPFLQKIENEFPEMSPNWRTSLISATQEELTDGKN